MNCQTAAEACVQSYATAMHLAQNPSTTPQSCAASMGAHYLPGMISFTFGHQHAFNTEADAVAGIASHLEKFEKHGLGMDIRLKTSTVKAVSVASAMCFVTWEIFPKNGVKGWEWENVYGYRKTQEGKEGWEFVVSDNEIQNLMERVPEFFS